MVSEKKRNESETVMLNFEFHVYSCDPSKTSKKEFGMIRFAKCQPYPSIFARIYSNIAFYFTKRFVFLKVVFLN